MKKIDRMSKEARSIEKKIDLYQKNNNIFKHNKEAIIYRLLENANGFIEKGMTNEKFPYMLENFIDGIDQSLRWIHKYCENDKIDTEENYNNIDYEIGKMVYDGISYNKICELFILATNGVLNDKVSKNKKNIYFEEINKDRLKRVASDLLNFSQASQLKEFYNNKEIQLSTKKWLEGHTILNGYLDMKNLNLRWVIDNKIEIAECFINYFTTYYENVSEFKTNNNIWNDWQFDGVKLKEFKQFYYILCVISQISAKINPYKIVKILPEEIEYIVLKLSSIEKGKVKKLIDFYTYSNENYNRNVSILSSPLVKEGEYILLAPYIVMSSLAEKNILDLINQKGEYQKYYNELSIHKETYIIKEIINTISKYKNLNIVCNKELPNKQGEIDILLLDEKSKSILSIEVKSLLTTKSRRDDLNKREHIEKGIKQCKTVNKYLTENLEDSIYRLFNVKNINVENIYSCVVTQNEIINTTMDYSIKVINKNDLYKIFEKFNGDLLDIINYIECEKYLPRKNIDYKVLKMEISYAGYKFKSNQVYDVNNKEVLKLKAMERYLKIKK